jgi:hypothetical protein
MKFIYIATRFLLKAKELARCETYIEQNPFAIDLTFASVASSPEDYELAGSGLEHYELF